MTAPKGGHPAALRLPGDLEVVVHHCLVDRAVSAPAARLERPRDRLATGERGRGDVLLELWLRGLLALEREVVEVGLVADDDPVSPRLERLDFRAVHLQRDGVARPNDTLERAGGRAAAERRARRGECGGSDDGDDG